MWIRLVGKVVIYAILIYLVYIAVSNLQGRKKKPSKYLFLGFAIFFSLAGIFCIGTLIFAFINGRFSIFSSVGGILILILTIASLIISPLFFWIYFKKFK